MVPPTIDRHPMPARVNNEAAVGGRSAKALANDVRAPPTTTNPTNGHVAMTLGAIPVHATTVPSSRRIATPQTMPILIQARGPRMGGGAFLAAAAASSPRLESGGASTG